MSSTETTTPPVGGSDAAMPAGPRPGAGDSSAAENSLDAALRAAEAAVALINNTTPSSSVGAAAAPAAAPLAPDEASRKLEALDAQLAADADSQASAPASPDAAATPPTNTPPVAAPPAEGAGAVTAEGSAPAAALGDNSPVPVFAKPATPEATSGAAATSDAGNAAGSTAPAPRENLAARSGRLALQILAAVNSPWHHLSASMRTLVFALTLGNLVTGGAAMGMAWMRMNAAHHRDEAEHGPTAGHERGGSEEDAHGASDVEQGHEVEAAEADAHGAHGAGINEHESPATDESGSTPTGEHEASEPSHGAESTGH